MSKLIGRYFVIAVSLILLPLAHATVLVPGGGPQIFVFGDVGSGADGNSYTFSGPSVLTIVDGFLDGDQFSVYDGAVFLGNTSTPLNDGQFCGDYATCLSSTAYSSGSYTFGAGTHSVDIFVLQSPYGDGGAFLELNPAATPEPGSLLLVGTGVLSVVGAVRRRRLA